MNLAEVYAVLEGLPEVGEKKIPGKDLVAAIKAEAEAKNRQEQNLRTRHKAVLEALGLNADSPTIDADAKAIKEKADAAKGAQDGKTALEQRLETLELENKAVKTEREQEKAKNLLLKKRSTLQAALGQQKVSKYQDVAISTLMELVEVDEADADKLHLKLPTGRKSLDEGLKEWLKDRPELVDNTAKPGSGSKPVPQGKGVADGDTPPIVDPVERLKEARRAQAKT